ncbi:co-chaperone GroES [Candidatus Kaiserbacteria bacterium CG10_big_fil_rev_8_21_14_0_10_45_20]|uniref:Co-chaperonin GroES n=1 Tax=Candidatus Kaiserbacteria bacterium CG10_big_fil_rev_8_21_14_0_10_45_20 TaxID=1974607 RepID=A0A2H0UG32_9BACT|nr:MAG: co-chaperone GroES [Candidatus Kaiserbacteria bacterium CG10_big_fil_rev_8_21_14_0_10_45_20]
MKKTTKTAVKKSTATKTDNVPVQPLADRVVIRPLSPEEMGTKTASGIIIPDTAQEKATEGEVVAVGSGKYENGEHIPMSVSVKDKVMFSKYGYDEIKIGGKEYFIVAESNILAIIN